MMVIHIAINALLSAINSATKLPPKKHDESEIKNCE